MSIDNPLDEQAITAAREQAAQTEANEATVRRALSAAMPNLQAIVDTSTDPDAVTIAKAVRLLIREDLRLYDGTE